MQSRSDIISILRNELPNLRTKFHVNSLKLFGSVARGQHHRSSDIDILVTFSNTPSLFTLVRLESYLFHKTGSKVDLILEESTKPAFQKRISKDIIVI